MDKSFDQIIAEFAGLDLYNPFDLLTDVQYDNLEEPTIIEHETIPVQVSRRYKRRRHYTDQFRTKRKVYRTRYAKKLKSAQKYLGVLTQQKSFAMAEFAPLVQSDDAIWSFGEDSGDAWFQNSDGPFEESNHVITDQLTPIMIDFANVATVSVHSPYEPSNGRFDIEQETQTDMDVQTASFEPTDVVPMPICFDRCWNFE